MTIQPETSIGELVADRPELGTVFEQMGIDYCCGGKRNLTEVCRDAEISVESLIARLEAAKAADRSRTEIDPSKLSLSELIDHIVTTHHDYLRKTLPQLNKMVAKVAEAHGERNPKMTELPAVMAGFIGEIMSHMMKEEGMLFPAICQIEQSPAETRLPFGSVANPIGVMESEHESAGRALEQFRTLTDNYTVPDWGCNTYRSLVHELSVLEQDMHQHIHKENNILFPKAIALEESLS
ncbi:MAG TPA: iron-sulfur cluster repair di-iron protein [candidate division Zixibacteria bacterium]|nr:iron-sulfur cluster repair di-iron protein [candidate division Zixibacteria bacterium]